MNRYVRTHDQKKSYRPNRKAITYVRGLAKDYATLSVSSPLSKREARNVVSLAYQQGRQEASYSKDRRYAYNRFVKNAGRSSRTKSRGRLGLPSGRR